MSTDDSRGAGGPERGINRGELEQEIRNARALLDDSDEQPQSFFVGVKYDSGADFSFAHAPSSNLDEKVYDLFLPLAVHCEQVASAANSDAETVFEVLEEIMDSDAFSRNMGPGKR